MRILICGAGTVGSSIAELLCQHRHSVTVVDVDPGKVRRLNEQLDVRAITGSASQSSVLFQAGVLGSDLFLAVTGIDEVNLIAGSMAKAMGTHRSVARVYAPVFRDLSTFDYQRHFGIDRMLSIENLSALELAREIRQPGSVLVESFARGELEVQEVFVTPRVKVLGVPLKSLGLPKGVRVASILRGSRLSIAGAEDHLEVGDRVTLIGNREDLDRVIETFRSDSGPKLGVVIAGGGETGYHLAQVLEGDRFGIVLMERDRDRCDFLAANLRHTTVVHSDCTRQANLEEERVGTADVFVACTGDDEDNIMAGVEARELGAAKIMAIVSRPDYANVVTKLGIDHVVSPRKVMAKEILRYLHKGPVMSRASLRDGGVEILEIVVEPGVPATEHVLANLRLPAKCLIAAVVRSEYVRVPGADDRLQVGDTVIAMVEESAVDPLLKVFSVNGSSS